jgi:sugar lactone lactonase YvrE
MRTATLTILASLLSACGSNGIVNSNVAQLPGMVTQGSALGGKHVGQVLYVPDQALNEITTYGMDGKRTFPTITQNVDFPTSVAVDASGKIYVVNAGSGTVTTYLPDGTETTPTISGLAGPWGIAVDRHGKIYVVTPGYQSCYFGNVTTYKPDGTRATPTIQIDGEPNGIAIDSSGKIYVSLYCAGPSGEGEVNTYKPDGTPTAPTLTDAQGILNPVGMTIAHDKLFVADGTGGWWWGSVTTYTLDGRPAKPTLTYQGIAGPIGVAVNRNGKIFVANQLAGKGQVYGDITSFLPNGPETKPTIVNGIRQPGFIAVSP